MLNRLQIDPVRNLGVAAVPAISRTPVRSRVVLLGGANPDTCIAFNTRRLIDAASSCIDWVQPESAEALAAAPLNCERPPLVLAAPEKGHAVRQQLGNGLFATLTVIRGLSGVSWRQSSGVPDIAIIRQHGQPDTSARPGSNLPALFRTINLAFQFARLNHRPVVTGTCDTRLLGAVGNPFELAFRQAAAAFPDIEAECLGMSRCSRRLVQGCSRPMTIVASGSAADALANVAASACVSAYLIPEIHAGDRAMVFTSQSGESASLADCGYANPTGCILSAVALLDHLGASTAAEAIHHALLATLEDGSELTPDIACRYPGVSTRQFTNAVIANLGIRSTRQSGAEWPRFHLPRNASLVLGQVANQ